MIKKMRMKFTMAAVGVIFVVLLITMGIVNFMNYRQIVSDADFILDILSEHKGNFPQSSGKPRWNQRAVMSPEAPYESRYFSVQIGNDGAVIRTDTVKIEAVNKEAAEEYAAEVVENAGKRGFIDMYRYKKTDQGNGKIFIVFLDCQKSISTFCNFLLTSVLVSVLGILVVFLFLVFASRRIVMPLAESYEKQKRFITDAGHEIKTPLTIITADAAVLEMEVGQSEWIQDIQKQTERLKELTNDLIYLSRIQEGGNAGYKTDFSISEIASETVESFQGPAKAWNKTFCFFIQPLLSYCGNQQEIQKLLCILLDNAIKYSDDGGEISFRLEKKGRNICITVFNTAKNIDLQQLPHLFERFYRMDRARNSGTGGYGIGLSIAKAIVKAHKGKISVLSKDGKSIEFIVLL